MYSYCRQIRHFHTASLNIVFKNKMQFYGYKIFHIQLFINWLFYSHILSVYSHIFYFILFYFILFFLQVIEDRVLECYGQNYTQGLPAADPSTPDSAYLELAEVLGDEQLQKVRFIIFICSAILLISLF